MYYLVNYYLIIFTFYVPELPSKFHLFDVAAVFVHFNIYIYHQIPPIHPTFVVSHKTR